MALFGRQSPLMYFLARRCLRFLKKFENQEYRIDRNGEGWLLAAMAPFKSSVIVDVGCNKGDWAAAARKANPQAHIYAFEIMPDTAEKAKARFAGDDRITIFDVGLGDETGEVTVHFSPEKTTITSLYPSTDERATETHQARIEQASEFLGAQGIDMIDILKIDVEGAEHLVLKGLKPYLTAGKVRLIQFEYGLNNIQTRVLLKDFHDMLDGFGYSLGKLYPNGVGFKTYEPHDENFWGPNYIAIRKDDDTLRQALSLPGFRSLFSKAKRRA